MPKHDFLSPKAISNRIKSKGLQKLRWYCQMCQKQCRDANGFKCHCESESHQRQMAIFAENPDMHFDEFSKDFEEGMMDIISRRYRYKRVHANLVYNEYIKDKHHIHMNATQWVTLTGFVTYLGRSGKCKVEETPKGWYVTYIERDPEILARDERMRKKEQADLDDEERIAHEVEQRARLAAQLEGAPAETGPVDHDLKRDENGEAPKIGFTLNVSRLKQQELKKVAVQPADVPELEESDLAVGSDADASAANPSGDSPAPADSASPALPAAASSTAAAAAAASASASMPPPPARTSFSLSSGNGASSVGIKREADRSASDSRDADNKKPKKSYADSLKEIMREEELKKERLNRKPYWLAENIVVKVLNKAVGDGKYYKQKGVVTKVMDKYIGLVKMIESRDVLKMDQDQLETVLPNIGGRVRILNGAHRGDEATLLSIKPDKFCAQLRIESGLRRGLEVEVEYEDFSKINQ